jgi:glycosidase
MNEGFKAPAWAERTNIYEVNTRQYTPEGTFEAFRAHLPRLRDMGVETLWFMPVTPISVKGRKGSLGSYYACSSYRAINPEFGSMENFRQLVQEAQGMGMRVLIDWVANHTGQDHEWTALNPDFYLKNEAGQFYDAHGWDDVIDLNYQNPEMRLAMIDSMAWWIRETGIDGFRCDMAMLTPVDFWIQARTALEPIRKLFWLAELDPLDNPDYMAVFDAAYSWTWMHETRKFIQDPAARNLHPLHECMFRYGQLWRPDARPAWFTSNHDENSWNGTEYDKYGVMAPSLAVFSCTWPGVPLLYSGQELPNYKRLEFFDRDPIQWDHEPQLHRFYQILFRLRQVHPAMHNAQQHPNDLLLEHNQTSHVLAFQRCSESAAILVFLNWSDYAWDLDIRSIAHPGGYQEIFTETQMVFGASASICVEPWGYQVWTRMEA